MSASTLASFELASAHVPGPVPCHLLEPADARGDLPLLLFLHGGNGYAGFLESMRPTFERAWRDGTLPPLRVATPSTGRSFYLDWQDGSQRWETFLLEDLLVELRRRLAVSAAREHTLLAGISMGGMGGLRLAFKYPETFGAVAALEPGIEPALRYADVHLRDRLYRTDALIRERYGSPVDEAHWQANNPANLARRRAEQIAAHDLHIYLECGDSDSLYLYHGAEFLHRVLFDGGIAHEYRLVRGADHIGASLGGRVYDALAFLGRVLRGQVREDDLPIPAGATDMRALRGQIVSMRAAQGYAHVEPRWVAAGDAVLYAEVRGEPDAPGVLLLPSLGRGAEDFEALANRLALSGFRAITVQPRGIGGSSGPLEELTLHDLAADAAAAASACANGPVHVVGHAFGNRVARTLASDRPELVRGVVLVACGGKVPPAPEISAALGECFDFTRPEEQRMEAVRRAFFAPGNDPEVWRGGWHVELARAQIAAGVRTPLSDWWEAGKAPVVVLQGSDDVVATPDNARAVAQDLGERASVIEIAGAGHALLPEQPDAIAHAICTALREG